MARQLIRACLIFTRKMVKYSLPSTKQIIQTIYNQGYGTSLNVV
jgi:hypothetical protein